MSTQLKGTLVNGITFVDNTVTDALKAGLPRYFGGLVWLSGGPKLNITTVDVGFMSIEEQLKVKAVYQNQYALVVTLQVSYMGKHDWQALYLEALINSRNTNQGHRVWIYWEGRCIGNLSGMA